uniref:Uncharacterized protein n=1 Tax=Amphimedon queenslandica TaxID=400682 RepID=A0A1X7UHH5_AMPQE
MSLLLVVVLLFFSSSCSVSSGQYYVSDDCSSVTQSPCNPLSVYAGDMSQYNSTIFYFIGTTNIEYNVNMTSVKNVTLHGLDQSPSINGFPISVYYSDHVTISNLSFHCSVTVHSSYNVTITNSVFASDPGTMAFTSTYNVFDFKVSSVIFTGYEFIINYNPLPICSSELLHYSLILTSVNFTTGSGMTLHIQHSTTYNVSIIFDLVECCANILEFSLGGLFNFFIINSSFHDNVSGFSVLFVGYSKSSDCTYPGIQLTSTLILENSQFYNNRQGLKINSGEYLLKAVNYYLHYY